MLPGRLLSTQIGQKLQERGEAVVDRSRNDEENEDDADDDARRFERLQGRGPSDAFEFEKGLLDLSAHADKDIGLLVLVCLLLFLVFDNGFTAVFGFDIFGFRHNDFSDRRGVTRCYLDSL